MSDARRVKALTFLCMLLGWGCSSCDSSSAAPTRSWPIAPPEEQGFDSAALAAVVEKIDREDLPIDSVQLVRNGVLVLDAYFYPYLGDRPHDVASVTKSITSTLVGIAVEQGLLELDQQVTASFADIVTIPPSDPRTGIELEHLLTMTSGLDCGRRPGEPELYEMIGTEHFVRYALDLPVAVPPGTQFAYCSPGSHLLSAMIGRAYGSSALDFAREHLFDPLDITDVQWPSDPQGVSHGWGDLQLHPRDMLRIGLLFLNEGNWNGTQVVSKNWVESATRAHVLAQADGTGYGYKWWILGGDFEGVYEARGRGGQAIIVWPEADVVGVFTGRGIDVRGEIAPLIAAAMKSNGALDRNPDAHARLRDAIRAATDAPPAKPIPPLPPTAAEVSGKVYRLAPNQFDVRCISLRFDSPGDVSLRLTLGGRGEFDFPVGMDGVPRFSENGPTGMPVGVTGDWTAPNVFSMSYDEVAGVNHLRIHGDFGTDPASVALRFSDAGGSFPSQLVEGVSGASCD
jgi:CubicO group peptidase (beta-lactamase class C family)